MTTRHAAEPQGALADLKVLDMAGPIGVYCTKLLADLGADVIRIEPPSGDPMRKLGPFYEDDPNPDKSLYWWHYNTSKRGITLDLEKAQGQALFKRLVQKIDLVVESFEPGYLDRLGLGYEALRALNHRLILTSITPFGQTGPFAHWKGPDIVGQAKSGLMYAQGYPDRAPYPLASENAYWAAGCLAANGTMLAVHFREAGGEGQHIDVSMQAAMAIGGTAMPSFDITHEVPLRAQPAPLMTGGGPPVRSIYPCKDGFVMFSAAAPGTQVDWVRDLLAEHGLGEEFDPRWLDIAWLRNNPPERLKFEDLMLRFFARFNKWELMDLAFKRKNRVFIYSIDNAKDVANSPQLQARGFFNDVPHPELGKTIRYPGPPAALPASPARISRRAPRMGEHNHEVYGEILGLTTEEMRRLQRDGVI
ncbi:MAG: CoA transferase [Dehalococcoidia bacterium]|nr:CoA transferase [Dehalococcoidia bacterium]